MAHFLKKIPMYIFIAINLLMIMAMNFCAYTSYLPPQTYPNWSYYGLMFPIFLIANILFIFFWLTFKWKLAALPVVGMLLCAGSIRTYCPVNMAEDIPKGSLKVLTYNVMGFGLDHPDNWEDNEILKYILDCDADIVCIQEAMRGNVDMAFELMKEKYPYQDMQFSALNYMAVVSKHPIISSQKIEYTSDSNCSYAYEIEVGKDTVVVINNHFESYRLHEEDREAYKELIKHPKKEDTEEKYTSLMGKLAHSNSIRGPQADSVASYIEKQKGRYIIACGDFNDPSLSYTHRRLTEYLNDAYTRSGNGPGISYNRSGMLFRIDNILCSPNITPYSATVDNYSEVSDHYPMFSFLKLE